MRPNSPSAAPAAFSLLSLLCLPPLLSGCVFEVDGWWWGGGPQVWIEVQETFRIPAEGLTAFSCAVHNGAIDARSRDGADEVVVRVEKRAGGADRQDAEAALAALEIVREVRDGALELGWEWTASRQTSWGASVRFDITHPNGLAAHLSSHNGGIRLRGAHPSVTAETHNGQIHVESTTSAINATSHNGEIDVDLGHSAAPSGLITTHNGSITLRLAEQASTRIRCQTHNGSISTSLRLEDPFRGDNFLIGQLGGGQGDLRITAHNGSIGIRGSIENR